MAYVSTRRQKISGADNQTKNKSTDAYVSERRKKVQGIVDEAAEQSESVKTADSGLTKIPYVSPNKKAVQEKKDTTRQKQNVKESRLNEGSTPTMSYALLDNLKKASTIPTQKAAVTQKPFTQTPIDQRLQIGGEATKNDNRSYIGMNIIPAYKEDTGLEKVGKGVVNYGVGGALSLASNLAGSVGQAMMQTVSNTDKAIKGEKLDFSEKTLRKDILPKQYDEALTNLAKTGKGGALASQAIDMLINMGLDPTTYIGGGIVDDLSRAGIMGKASKPSTEFVKLVGERQQAILAKQAAKTAKAAVNSVDAPMANKAAGIADDANIKQATSTIDTPTVNKVAGVEDTVAVKPTQVVQPKIEAEQVNTPTVNKIAQNGVQEVAPKTPSQQKYVEQVTAKLPDDADGLSKKIAELEAAKSVEKDGHKLLKINLQLFAAKKKLDGLSKVYSNTLKNTDVIPQEVKNLLDEDDFRYDPLTEKQQLETARTKINADTDGELKRIQDLSRTEYNQDDVNVGMELLHDLSNKKDLTADEIANIRKTAKGVSQAGRTQGRGVQAFAKYTRTKEGVIASTQKVVDKVEDGIKNTNPKLMDKVKKEAEEIFNKAKREGKKADYDKILSQVKRKYNVPDLTDGDIKAIADYMDKYKSAMPGSREAKEAWYKVMQIMSNKIPPTLVDKFRGLQRVSYLLNPKTLLVRNPTGNVVMNIAETIKDLPGAMVDKVTSAVRKSDRTTALPSVGRLRAQFKGAKSGLGEALKDIKAGVDTSPTIGMLEMPRRDVFSNNNLIGKALNKADKLVGQMLQLGDRPFYTAAYDERISDLLKLGKTKEVTQEMMDAANDYALERVFQNDSGIAQVFKALKTPPAKAPQGLKDAWGFIVNGVIPFSKTPANILNKLLEYSPAGLAKAIGHGAYSKAGKTVFNQKYFVDNIARGLTGTGLATLGYTMASKGLIKGKADSDKDVAALERLMGINSYSFVIDGKSYTFDWAQPVGSVLAAGADAYYSGMNKDNFSEQLNAALQGYGNTFFNQSMMQSLTRFLNTYNPISGVVSSVTGTANIVTPTFGAQVAKTIDPYVRDTSADTGIGETVNKQLVRIPGLSMTLPKKIDTLGQEQKQSQGRGIMARAVEQFVSPGYFGDTEKSNETMKKIYEIYKATDEKAVFPKLAPESFSRTVKGEKETVKLTAEQKREWQKISGDFYSKNFTHRIKDRPDDEARAKALKKLADDAYDFAKKKMFPK